MKKHTLNILALFAALLTLGSCKKSPDEFLNQPPLDNFTDQQFWKSEQQIRAFAWGYYPTYFTGYSSGFDLGFGGYFSGESLNDDFAPTTPATFTKNVPATGGGYSFDLIRRYNIMINRIGSSPLEAEPKKNWLGVSRFFRAMEYSRKVQRFGDYPWLNATLEESDGQALYKPRDPRTLVMDSVLADFKYAAENVRAVDAATGPQGLIINKYVVLAFMSRQLLFEGSWQKYQANNTAKANQYFEAARWAAEQVINSGKYKLNDDYRSNFNSLDLANNPEMIMYRRYEQGKLTHALVSYNNLEPQAGMSRDAFEAYLNKDGLPLSQSPLTKPYKSFDSLVVNRDARLTATIVPTIRLNGEVSNYSTSGIATRKFYNESLANTPDALSSTNSTDAPVIRYGEILLNYAEAAAELGLLDQAALNKSINVLRKRASVNMPEVTLSGNSLAVNGTVVNDPLRDADVSPLMWELRRERRIELMFEGFRNADLRRWAKYDYIDNTKRPKIDQGVYIIKSQHPKAAVTIRQNPLVVEPNATEGYVTPATVQSTLRTFTDPKVYLDPLPLDQIKLYKDAGVELKQNPGW